jgi:hypothetical protein
MLILHNAGKDDKNPGLWHFPGDLPDSDVTSCYAIASMGLSFAITYQSRRNHPVETDSLSFGLVVHLILIPILPHDNTVAFGYRL